MPIDKRSRYFKSQTVPWTRRDGTQAELIAPTPRPDRPAVFQRLATDTDRLDTLAATYYRDPAHLWRIADAAEVLDPFDAVVRGHPIAIPPNK